MKDFKKLKIWQNAMDITDAVFDIYEPLPWQSSGVEEPIPSCRDLDRLEIAEGNSRRSEKDKLRFMEMALGSTFELETQTLILQRRDWCPEAAVPELLKAIDEQQKMLLAFMAKLKP